MRIPGRGDEALRRHRVSLPNTTYFVTLCTDGRKTGLTADGIASKIRDELNGITAAGHWRERAAILMPDHAHLLIVLNGDLPLSRCIARLKAKTRAAMSVERLAWQGNFYEHRLRPDDSIEDVLRYMFLNPYRERLVSVSQSYSWFWLGDDERAWFNPTLDDGRPFPEWLR